MSLKNEVRVKDLSAWFENSKKKFKGVLIYGRWQNFTLTVDQ